MAGWPCGEGTHHASNNCEVVSTADCLPSTMFCAVQYSDHTPRLRDSYEVLVLCGLSSPRNKVRRAVLAADLQPSLGLAHLYPTPHPSPLRVSAIIHAAYPQPARVTPSGTRQSPFKFSTLLGLFFPSFSGPGSQSHSHPARRQAKGQGSFPYERHDDDSALRSGSPAVPLPLSQENALLETRTPEGQGEPGLLYKYCTLVCMSTVQVR